MHEINNLHLRAENVQINYEFVERSLINVRGIERGLGVGVNSGDLF